MDKENLTTSSGIVCIQQESLGSPNKSLMDAYG
jgi:hypothetical protein